MPEVALHLGRQVGPRSFGVEVDHADVHQLGGAGDECLEEDFRSRGRALDVDLVAGLDPGNGFLGAHDTHGHIHA